MVSWSGLGYHPGLSFHLEPEPEEEKKLPNQEQRPWVKARAACLGQHCVKSTSAGTGWCHTHPHTHTHTPTQGHWIWQGGHNLGPLTRPSAWKGSSYAARPHLIPGPQSSGPHSDMRLLSCHAMFHAMPLHFLSVFLKSLWFYMEENSGSEILNSLPSLCCTVREALHWGTWR